MEDRDVLQAVEDIYETSSYATREMVIERLLPKGFRDCDDDELRAMVYDIVTKQLSEALERLAAAKQLYVYGDDVGFIVEKPAPEKKKPSADRPCTRSFPTDLGDCPWCCHPVKSHRVRNFSDGYQQWMTGYSVPRGVVAEAAAYRSKLAYGRPKSRITVGLRQMWEE